jgi:hypothetical protein
MAVLETLLGRYFPDIYDKITALNIPLSAICLSWFMTLYIVAFPLDVRPLFLSLFL